MARSLLPRTDEILDQILDMAERDGTGIDRAAAELLADESEEVREQVNGLLPRLRTQADLLDQGVLGAAPDLSDHLDSLPPGVGGAPQIGELVGPYRLLEVIGRGGMGVVYLAERANKQYEQRVAIKLMSGEARGTAARSRLYRERQFLADLEHPSIARLLDGGVTEGGDPYLVMEWVEGRRIDEHCDAIDATVDERLSLFLDVCDAVEYAHRQLVVHRDLKPANILVTSSGQVKLLDFGIARLLDPEEDGTGATQTVVRAFTPEYASPEQLRGARVAIPSDVYSLGALLYRLLTGSSPRNIQGRDLSEISKLIEEVTLKPPSRAVMARDRDGQGGAGSASTNRRMASRLQGDLDNVVLKAMANEPDERYGTVGELAGDLRNHLAGLPVRARTATVWYRLGKFLGRHRLAAAAVGGIFLSLILGLTLTLRQAEKTAQQRDRAQREATKAETVADFLVELFASADPFSTGGEEPSVRDLLASGEQRILRDQALHPAVRADLLNAIALAYRGLGDQVRAQPLSAEALNLYRSLPEPEPVGLARALKVHGNSMYGHDPETARQLLLEAATTMTEAGLAQTTDFAQILADTGRLSGTPAEEKERLFQRALDIRRAAGETKSSEVANLLQNQASLLESKGEFSESIRLKRESLAMIEEVLGLEHPMYHQVTNNLAHVLYLKGELLEAERYYSTAAEQLEKSLGPNHPALANIQSSYGRLLLDLGQIDQAERFVESAARLGSTAIGESFATAAQRINVGTLRREQGRAAEALELYESSESFLREQLGEDHPGVARVRSLMARTLWILGDEERAEELYRLALAVQQDAAPSDRSLAETRRCFGGLLCDRGRMDEGGALVQQGCNGFEDPKRDPIVAALCLLERSSCDQADSSVDGVVPTLAASREAFSALLPQDHYVFERLDRLERRKRAGS